MKKVFFLLLCLCCYNAFGQDNYFGWENPKKHTEKGSTAQEYESCLKVEQNNLIWQKVYYETRTQSDIIRSLRTSGKVTNVDITDEVIVCNIPATKFDYEAVGLKRGNTPMYLLGNDFTAFVRIQVKEDRYRVTVSDIILITNITTPLGQVGETDVIETYAIKNGTLTKSAIKYIEPILNEQFDSIFLAQPKLDDEW